MVPPASHKLTGVRGTQDTSAGPSTVLYGTLTSSGGVFQRLPVVQVPACAGPTTPAGLATRWFGLFPSRSPLLRESRLISLRRATEMFQFAHGPPPCLCIEHGVSRHHSGRVAPLGYSGLLARMQLPLNVSPVSASFIGLQRQGIHPVLCRACALDTSLHFSPDGCQVRWIGVMMCSFVLLCFAFAGVFSAKSK